MNTAEPSAEVPQHNHPVIKRRIDGLEEELAALREELVEQRQLGLKVAHLTDLVTSLIGAAARGPEEFDRALAAYVAELR
jgi:hypothetical protein